MKIKKTLQWRRWCFVVPKYSCQRSQRHLEIFMLITDRRVLTSDRWHARVSCICFVDQCLCTHARGWPAYHKMRSAKTGHPCPWFIVEVFLPIWWQNVSAAGLTSSCLHRTSMLASMNCPGSSKKYVPSLKNGGNTVAVWITNQVRWKCWGSALNLTCRLKFRRSEYGWHC